MAEEKKDISNALPFGRIVDMTSLGSQSAAEQKSRIPKDTLAEPRSKKLLERYEDVEIYSLDGEPVPVYVAPIPEFGQAERQVVDTIKEIATRLIKVSPEEIPLAERRKYFFDRIAKIIEQTPDVVRVPAAQREVFARLTVMDMIGYGPLDFLLADDKIEEVMVIGPNLPVYIFHRKWGMCSTNIMFLSDHKIIDIIDKIARDVQKSINRQEPLLDARLPDGSRVNATIPPVSIDGPTLTIRKFKRDPLTVLDLINYKTLNYGTAAFLWLCVDGMFSKPSNIIIAGGTGSGKTSLLNVLANFVPYMERVITIEDTAELDLPITHKVRFEGRSRSMAKGSDIGMQDLTINSLRMRPDRIIIGEVRGAEADTLLTAMNTGHDGCMGTIHANNSEETIIRLTSPPMNVPPIMLHGLDLIIILERIYDRKRGTIRRVTEISELHPEGSHVRVVPLFAWDPMTDTIKRTGQESSVMKVIAQYAGMTDAELEEEYQNRIDALRRFTAENIHDVKKLGNAVNRYYSNSVKV